MNYTKRLFNAQYKFDLGSIDEYRFVLRTKSKLHETTPCVVVTVIELFRNNNKIQTSLGWT